jgi:predicted DNA-binding helix-hairpin-helix protein
MNTIEKLSVLGGAAKWDSCSCDCVPEREKTDNRVGERLNCVITRSVTPEGKEISLFKTLQTNSCSYDCRYCANSTRCPESRVASFGPEELARTFMKLYVKNYVEGLFLSSGIARDPESSMEEMLSTVSLLRERFLFRGYVHLKILPGASREQVKQAGELADRLSVNLEVPNSSRLREVSDVKEYRTDILRRQRWIKGAGSRAGQTTQLVVGGSDEPDSEILRMSDWEYRNMSLRRIYYSGFVPLDGTPFEGKDKTPQEREISLYRADFLMRSYKYEISLLDGIMEDGMLPRGDPKVHVARAFIDSPVDVNEAQYRELVMVPGIGHLSAMRICGMQRAGEKIANRRQLKNIGVVLKRAEPFLRIGGHVQKTLEVF